MKKILILMMAFIMVFGLTACGSGVDKQALIDAFNVASDCFDEVGALVNKNIDSVDPATVETLTEISEKLLIYKAMAENDEKLTQESMDEAITYLKTVPATMQTIKTEVEANLVTSANATTDALYYSAITS